VFSLELAQLLVQRMLACVELQWHRELQPDIELIQALPAELV
jgi:hypothetical protein